LINLRGEVIGINTAIISGSGGSQGIGFAIPSNTVRMAFESLLKQGRIIRGYLGIETPAIQRGQQEEESSGVLVTAVLPNSPAAEAQIQKGDVIQKFDGREVDNISELRHLVSQVELHKKVALDVLRNGKQIKVTAEIKEQPTNFQTARVNPRQPRPLPPRSQVPREPDDQRNESGGGLASIEVRELTPDLARTLGVPAGVHGVVVAQTDPNGGTAELRVGDVIEEINQQPISSVQDFEKVVQSLPPNQTQVLSVCRHRTRSFVVVRPG
jgi:serine protease Do